MGIFRLIQLVSAITQLVHLLIESAHSFIRASAQEASGRHPRHPEASFGQTWRAFIFSQQVYRQRVYRQRAFLTR